MGYGRHRTTFCRTTLYGNSRDISFGADYMDLELWVGPSKKYRTIIAKLSISLDDRTGEGVLEIDGKEVKRILL